MTIYDTLNRITVSQLVDLLRKGGFEILTDHRVRDDSEIPPSLLEVYHEDVLRTHGIGVVARAAV